MVKKLAADGDFKGAEAFANRPHASGPHRRPRQRTELTDIRRMWICEGAAMGGHWDTFVLAGGLLPSTRIGDSISLAALHDREDFLKQAIDHVEKLQREDIITAVCTYQRKDVLHYLLTRWNGPRLLISTLLQRCAESGWIEGVGLVLLVMAINGDMTYTPGSLERILVLGCALGGSVPFYHYLCEEWPAADFFPMLDNVVVLGHWALMRAAFSGAHAKFVMLPPVPLRLSRFRLLTYMGVITDCAAVEYVADKSSALNPLWRPMMAFLVHPRHGARNKAAVLCALVIQFCDGFLRPKRYLRWPGAGADPRPGNRWLRLLILAEKLPQELQMVLCLRAFGLTSDVITWDLLRTGMRHLDMMLLPRSDSIPFVAYGV